MVAIWALFGPLGKFRGIPISVPQMRLATNTVRRPLVSASHGIFHYFTIFSNLYFEDAGITFLAFSNR